MRHLAVWKRWMAAIVLTTGIFAALGGPGALGALPGSHSLGGDGWPIPPSSSSVTIG